MSKWHGVKLNSEGCVEEINLPNNNLDGFLPALVLPRLKVLNLANNNLVGTLPNFTTNPDLERINLSSNFIRGSLPGFFINNDLIEINLSYNQFEGDLPDYSNKVNLKIINLTFNNISGSLFSLKSLINLEQLEFANNDISGDISDITLLTKLKRLLVENNKLTGEIGGFTQLIDIEYFNASKNQLTGSLPTILNKEELEVFDVSENQLTGSFSWPKNAPNLRVYDIANNQVQGSIYVEEFIELPKLEELILSYNQLSGQIPNLIFKELDYLLVDNNEFEGEIPTLENLLSLKQARFNNNKFKDISLSLDLFDHLEFLFLEYNYFTFVDVLPYSSYLGKTMFLQPQFNIPFQFDSFTISKGNNFTLELLTDENHSSTEFNWYHNGERINVNTNHTLLLSNANPSRAGKYSVRMSNFRTPGFILYSDTIDIDVTCPLVVDEEVVYLCPGQSFQYKGQTYSENSEIRDTVLSTDIRVCDSLYIISIREAEHDYTLVSEGHCPSDTVYFGPDSVILTRSGIYIDTFQNYAGCDSIVEFHLEIYTGGSFTIDKKLCQGDVFSFQGVDYDSDTTLMEFLQSVNGCDSTVIYNVSFHDPIITSVYYPLCNGDTIIIDDLPFYSNSYYVDTLQAVGGCDSIVQYTVQIFQNYQVTRDIVICGDGGYDFNGDILYESGKYIDTLNTLNGCDSIVTINLTVYPNYLIRDTVQLCFGDSILFNNAYLKTIGSYFADLTSVNGCDSMHYLTIERAHYLNIDREFTACLGDTIWFLDKPYTESGLYVDTVANIFSCDTVFHLDIYFSDLFLTDTIVRGSGSQDSTGSIEIVVAGGLGGYSYQWETGDTTNKIENQPIDTFAVLVTDSLGCHEQFRLEVPLNTFVRPSLILKNWIEVHPNVLNRNGGVPLTIKVIQDMHRPEMILYNALGYQVWRKEYPLLGSQEILYYQMPQLPAGMYWLHVTEKGTRFYQSEKLILY
ncbi:hypothetical protein GCM10025777_24120 [Membranihabitans marinus]